jgi:hypothetical protein
MADDPAPARPGKLAMPSPEQLGVNAAKAADAPDWSATRRALQELGAVSFQLDRLPGGAHQFVCLLPTADPEKPHRVEAHGATEAEAVRRALDEARRWREQR